jgi:DNA-binding CsgD family transcriptional regulator
VSDDVREHGKALTALYRWAHHQPGSEVISDTAVERLLRADRTLRLLNWPPVAGQPDTRVLAGLPMRLAVGDSSVALLAPLPDGPPLAVRPPGLFDALAAMFDILWRLAAPTPPELDERDRAILTMMNAGATDDTIARRLNMSRRTVVRRTSALLCQLGVANRFQAGVRAARLGWL